MEDIYYTPTPKGIKTPEPTPTPTPIVDTDMEYRNWIIDNQAEFLNYNQKSPEFVDKMYKVYNHFYKTNKRPDGCGICKSNIQLELRRNFL